MSFSQKQPQQTMKKLVVLLALALMAFTCANNENTPEETLTDSEKLKTKESEIVDFIKDNACKPDRECGTIAFGSKPCGGPWKFLIYSLTAADVKLLTEKVTAYNALEKEVNIKTGRSSDCSVAIKPNVACVDGVCKIVQ